MTILLSTPWMPAVLGAALAAAAVIIRCLTLLVGLLAALPKTPELDRSEVFREFARATIGRHGGAQRRLRQSEQVGLVERTCDTDAI
jgi:hypothetical protein